MSTIDIKVPNIGDFKDVEIIEVLVQNGQEVSKGDPIITLESDKSSVEVPSDYSGKILKLKVKVGDKVSEGDLILELELTEKEVNRDNIKAKTQTQENKVNKEKVSHPKKILSNIQNISSSNNLALASPKARKFARELGADINKIKGSQKFGRVTEDDIKLFVSTGLNQNEQNKKYDTDKKTNFKHKGKPKIYALFQ